MKRKQIKIKINIKLIFGVEKKYMFFCKYMENVNTHYYAKNYILDYFIKLLMTLL